jgi:hypothetical protein
MRRQSRECTLSWRPDRTRPRPCAQADADVLQERQRALDEWKAFQVGMCTPVRPSHMILTRGGHPCIALCSRSHVGLRAQRCLQESRRDYAALQLDFKRELYGPRFAEKPFSLQKVMVEQIVDVSGGKRCCTGGWTGFARAAARHGCARRRGSCWSYRRKTVVSSWPAVLSLLCASVGMPHAGQGGAVQPQVKALWALQALRRAARAGTRFGRGRRKRLRGMRMTVLTCSGADGLLAGWRSMHEGW